MSMSNFATQEIEKAIAEQGGHIRDALNVALTRMDTFRTRAIEAEAALAAEREKSEKYETALYRLRDWSRAYPVDMFPEPDFKQVRIMLGDTLLSQVGASNMRHVVNGVGKIVDDVLPSLIEQEVE